MDEKQIVQIGKSAQEFLDVIMNLYWTHLQTLEAYIKRVPATETDTLIQLNEYVNEIQTAMEHDLGLFDKAISTDKEALRGIQDKLKINEIYKQLQK